VIGLELCSVLGFARPGLSRDNPLAFVVRDHNGQARSDEPGRRAAGKLLTRDKAQRVAANIAKLPELVSK